MQAKTAGSAAGHFHNAAARVAAIAAVHQQIREFSDIGTVELDQYLTDLCQAIATASSSPDRTWSLTVDADPLIVSTDIASADRAHRQRTDSRTPFSIRGLLAKPSKCRSCLKGPRRILQSAFPTRATVPSRPKPPNPALNMPDWARGWSSHWPAKSVPRS